MINKFTVESFLHRFLPTEDYAHSIGSENKSVIAIGDGITRDPCEVLPDDNLRGKLKFAWNYPRPSPATDAAVIFCNSFVYSGFLSSHGKSEKAVREAFRDANNNIGKFNDENFPEPDYLMKDFAGCVSAGAIISNQEVFYGFIGDSGIAVFNKNGDMKFKTENQGPNSKGSIDEDVAQKFKLSFRFPRGREIIRHHYRNNPKNLIGYGALTGEQKAMDYVETGYLELKEGDVVMGFTDGLENVILEGKFADKVKKRDLNGMKKLCKKRVKTEGSLVISL